MAYKVYEFFCELMKTQYHFFQRSIHVADVCQCAHGVPGLQDANPKEQITNANVTLDIVQVVTNVHVLVSSSCGHRKTTDKYFV